VVTVLKAFPFKSLSYSPPDPEVSEGIGAVGLGKGTLPSGSVSRPLQEEASVDILYDLYTLPESRLQANKLNKKGTL